MNPPALVTEPLNEIMIYIYIQSFHIPFLKGLTMNCGVHLIHQLLSMLFLSKYHKFARNWHAAANASFLEVSARVPCLFN